MRRKYPKNFLMCWRPNKADMPGVPADAQRINPSATGRIAQVRLLQSSLKSRKQRKWLGAAARRAKTSHFAMGPTGGYKSQLPNTTLCQFP